MQPVNHSRRRFVGGAVGLGVLALDQRGRGLPTLGRPANAQGTAAGILDGVSANEMGVILPEGFSSRVVAVAGLEPANNGFVFRNWADGGAVFGTDDGGWVHAVNHEGISPEQSGVSALKFSADGELVDAYSILGGTLRNCAGGATPWGTWLSCEEYDRGPGDAGGVWECDPSTPGEGVLKPLLGSFSHEAVAVDPVNEVLYLSEDQPDGLLYRFVPSAYPSLDDGVLEAALISDDGQISWETVPDPTAAENNTRYQVPGATLFNGGEGLWYHDGTVMFTTKGDNTVWAIDTTNDLIEVVYEPVSYTERTGEEAPLTGVDNVTIHPATGRAFVAEDGGNMELVMLDADGSAVPVIRFASAEHEGSEVTGPCFSPDGTRMYISSQRARLEPDEMERYGAQFAGLEMVQGVTYEITGPFDTLGAPAEVPTTTTAPSTTALAATATTTVAGDDDAASGTTAPSTTVAGGNGDSGGGDDGGGGGNTGAFVAIGVGAAVAVGAAGAAAAKSKKSDDSGRDDGAAHA